MEQNGSEPVVGAECADLIDLCVEGNLFAGATDSECAGDNRRRFREGPGDVQIDIATCDTGHGERRGSVLEEHAPGTIGGREGANDVGPGVEGDIAAVVCYVERSGRDRCRLREIAAGPKHNGSAGHACDVKSRGVCIGNGPDSVVDCE